MYISKPTWLVLPTYKPHPGRCLPASPGRTTQLDVHPAWPRFAATNNV